MEKNNLRNDFCFINMKKCRHSCKEKSKIRNILKNKKQQKNKQKSQKTKTKQKYKGGASCWLAGYPTSAIISLLTPAE